MTLEQSKNFVLSRLALKKLKKLKEASRFYDFGWERRGTGNLRPVVEPVPTPLTYYDAHGHCRIMS
jgi:hypothetical protein